MKNYSYTALSLLVCVTASGCYSERVKTIPEGTTEDAGDGTGRDQTSTATEPDLTDAGPTGDPTTGETSRTKPPKDTEEPDASNETNPTTDPKPDTVDDETNDSDTTTGEGSTDEPPHEEDEFFHPTPEGTDTTEESDPGPGWGADAGVGTGPAASGTNDWTSPTQGGTGGAGSNTSDDGDSPSEGEDDGEAEPDVGDVIEEADLIRREGDILYALSYGAGLAIVDISDPTHLELLGRTAFERTASEMYVDGDEVVVLFQGTNYSYDYWYGYDSETVIGVYDVSDPTLITEVDSASISGSLLDSRKIGDRLYVAANSGCYWCDNGGPTVSSFNLAGSGVAPIASLSIPVASQGGYAPTLYVNNERLYLAQENWGYVDGDGNPVDPDLGSSDSTGDVSWASGSTWAGSGATGATETWAGTEETTDATDPSEATEAVDSGFAEPGPTGAIDGGGVSTNTGTSSGGEYIYANWTTLQVVDISDASGAINLGASIKIDGSVNSRWQMDEHDGVLRVVSQDGWGGPAPVVETFTITNSDTFTKAGHLEIVLPRPETLESVRFDGDRGYVVTFEQVDPLFTLDLRDPAEPAQLGELEIPGFLYHMMPRGDRLYAIGYDNANDESLHASVFDVSDLANPVMIERVNFGGDWGYFGEGQDDIEKSVQMLDDQGLMLIPYTGYDYSEDSYCGYERSGIQLIDYTQDDLTLRGSTDAIGYARRAFYHRDHLFGYSDRAVQSFDITDRDNPVAVDTVTFAHSIERVVVVGDQLVRIGDDGLEHSFVDVVPVETPNAPVQDAALDLEGGSSCGYVRYFAPVARDGIVYLPREVYSYIDYTSKVNLIALDVRNPQAPVKLADAVLNEGLSELDDVRVLSTQNAIVVSQRQTIYDYLEVGGEPLGDVATDTGYEEDYGYGYYTSVRKLHLDVVDTRDVDATLAIASIDVEQAWLDNGFADGFNNLALTNYNSNQHSLVAGGNLVVSQHRVYEQDGSGYRYFAERLDVSNPAQPTWLEPVNVPGQALALANDDIHLVTADDVTVPIDEAECTQSEWDDYVICYNRMIELSALTLEDERAVRNAKVRLGSNADWFRIARDASAIYAQAGDDDQGNPDVLAYSFELEALGKLEAHPGYLTDWYGAPVLLDESQEPLSATLVSTESGVIEEAARVVDFRCDPAVLGESAAYCAAGVRGVEVTPFE